MIETPLKLHHERPDSMDGRPKTELAVYDLLDSLNIDYIKWYGILFV